MCQLENLGFIRDGTKWAADHTHTAGYTFILVDGSASLLIAFDRFYTAGTFAGAFFMGNGIIRTDRFASSAVNAFVLINKRFSINHGDGSFGTGLNAWMGNTAAAHIAYFVFIGFACRTCRRDYLHKRWFVIFLINIA